MYAAPEIPGSSTSPKISVARASWRVRHLPQILEAMTLKICSEVVLPSESLSKINGCLHAFK